MKITQKDKMMIIVLVLVLAVACFFVYGVMPQKDKIKAAEDKLKVQQEELQKKENEVISLKAAANRYKKMDELITNNIYDVEPKLPATMNRFELEEFLLNLFASYEISVGSTTGWNPLTTQRMVTLPDGKQIASHLNMVRVNITSVSKTGEYTITDDTVATAYPDSVYSYNPKIKIREFIDYVNNAPGFSIANYSEIRQEDIPKTEEPGEGETPEPEDKIAKLTYIMSFTLDVYMFNYEIPGCLKIDSNKINLDGDKLTFDVISEASSYELYSLSMLADGRVEEVKLDAELQVDIESGRGSFNLESLPAGTYRLAIRAIPKTTEFLKTAFSRHTKITAYSK